MTLKDDCTNIEVQCSVNNLSDTRDESDVVIFGEKKSQNNEIENKYCKDTAEIRDKHTAKTCVQEREIKGQEISETQNKLKGLINSLGLDDFSPNKIKLMDVMVVKNPLKTVTYTDIPWIVFKSLIMGNFESRDKMVQDLLQKTEKAKPASKQLVCSNKEHSFKSLLDQGNSNVSLNPMDLLIVLFHCSSPILKHILAQKLFMCKLAIPICFWSDTLDTIVFSSWMLTSIIIDLPSEGNLSKNSDITNYPCHFISFMRLGNISLSKSKILNDVLTDQHHTFFNKACPMGTSVRTVSEGTIECAWFLPSERPGILKNVLMCMNLRGDGLKHVSQVEILSNISTVVVVMIDVTWLNNEKTRKVLLNLHKSVNGVVIAIDAHSVDLIRFESIYNEYANHIGNFMKRTKFYVLSRADREINSFSTTESIQRLIVELTADIKPCTLSKQLTNKAYTNLEDGSKYQECKEKAKNILKNIPSRNSNVKDEIVPLQGETWKVLTKCCKTLNKTSEYTSIGAADEIRLQMIDVREKQIHICTHKLGSFMKSVIETLFEYLNDDLHFTFIIWWLKLLLDERSRRVLPKYLKEYQQDWQNLRAVKNNKQHKEINHLKEKLNKSEHNLAEASFGLEHVIRELGQMYEAMIECKTETLSYLSPINVTPRNLAAFGAKILLNGQPFEIMDGDTANVPLIWVKAVITELKNMIGNKKLLALSILGVQSSGKSTLLNTMFGVQFAVSAGRCTRGVFMQLVKVDSDSVPVDYIIVFDTEGLRAPELAHQKYSHDNELATFVIGLGDITIVNIKGENTAEVKDVLQIAVHAFLRLKLAKRVNLKQSCIFIHQNVPASDANNKMMQGRQKFLETLDEMTKEAAAQENIVDIYSFSQVIEFDCNKDVWYLSDLWHGDPPMAPVNPGYSRRVEEVRNTLLYKLASVRETYFTIINTILRIDDLWTGILKDDFVFSFRNSLEVKAYNNIDRKYHELSWKLEKSVSEFVLSKAKVEMYKCLNEEDFTNAVPRILTLCSKMVSKQVTDLNNDLDIYVDSSALKDIMVQWKQSKQNRLRILSEDLIERSKDSIKKTKEEIRIEKLRMNAQKSHEITINHRAQTLATEMRRTKPSEHVLKEGFDKLWKTWITNFKSEISEDCVSIKDEIESLIYEKFCADAAFVKCEAHDDEQNTDTAYLNEYVLIKDRTKSVLEEKYEQKVAWTMVKMSNAEFKMLKELIQIENIIKEIYITDCHIQIKKFLYLFGKDKKTCKQQTLDLTYDLLCKIEEYLLQIKKMNVNFDVKQVKHILELIRQHIEGQNTDNFALTYDYEKMVTSHIMKYAIVWFTKLNVNHNNRTSSSQSSYKTIRCETNVIGGTHVNTERNEPLKKLDGSITASNILPNHISMMKSCDMENWDTFADIRVDAVDITNKMLKKMDTRLAEYNTQDVRFEISFATEILMLISKDIDEHNHHVEKVFRYNLLPPYRAMIVKHVQPFITDFFVCMNEKYNKKHSPKCQMEEYKGTVWTLFKNVFESKSESVNAATFFREAITKTVIEYIDDHLPILVQEHIMTSFAHEKYKLMKTIMIDLAENDNFTFFSEFIQDPSEYTRGWLKRYINRDIFHRGADNCTTYGKLAKYQIKKSLKEVSVCIDKASNVCTNSGVKDISRWIQAFIQHSRDLNTLPFPNQAFVHVKNRKVEDLASYIDVIRNDLNEMENDILKVYDDTNKNTVQWKTNPNSKIMEKLWGCTNVCMFCAEPCRHTDKSHVEQDVQHQCIQHRPQGISGWHFSDTKNLVTEFCNCLIQTTDMQYRWGEEEPKESRYYKDYKSHFPEWDIVPSSDKSKYWMWVMCKYQDELKEIHDVEKPNLPETWKIITKEEAIESLSFV